MGGETKMTICNLCETKITNQSYFLRITEMTSKWGGKGKLVEVCPECHHMYRYAPKDMLESYKKRRNIK